MADTKKHLGDQGQGKDDEIEDVPPQVGDVAGDLGQLERAHGGVAVEVWIFEKLQGNHPIADGDSVICVECEMVGHFGGVGYD